MWKSPLIAGLIVLTTVVQIAFLSQLPFPFSTLSFPLVVVAYGVVRNRPLLALSWALLAGFILDLHGLLGFGAEIFALFAAFFAARFLFLRVVTNAGAVALFLVGAFAALTHWFALAAIDGLRVIFGAVPILVDLSAASMLAPLRQALVNGLALLAMMAAGNALERRYRRTFLSHVSTTHPLS